MHSLATAHKRKQSINLMCINLICLHKYQDRIHSLIPTRYTTSLFAPPTLKIGILYHLQLETGSWLGQPLCRAALSTPVPTRTHQLTRRSAGLSERLAHRLSFLGVLCYSGTCQTPDTGLRIPVCLPMCVVFNVYHI